MLHNDKRWDGAVIESEQRGADELLTTGRPPETVDRVLVGVCGAIWLVLLAASVFATVAMARLGSGHPSGGDGQSPWLLYSIIAVSALIIAGAVPLLLRARRSATAAGAGDASPDAESAPVQPTEAATERMRVFGVDPYAVRQSELPRARLSQPFIDRLWLRGSASLLSAMGLALTAVAVGAYLLADGNDTGAWVAFGLAGVITVAMPAVLVFFQRQLGEAVEAAE